MQRTEAHVAQTDSGRQNKATSQHHEGTRGTRTRRGRKPRSATEKPADTSGERRGEKLRRAAANPGEKQFQDLN